MFDELSRLKRTAAKLYRQHAVAVDSEPCGAGLAGDMGLPSARIADEFNAIWKRIRELDPSAPDARLS